MNNFQTIGVCGGGTMGRGIALASLLTDYTVVLCDLNQDVLAKAQKYISEQLQKSVEKGKLSAEDAEKFSGKISYTADIQGFAPCDLVIEAIIENQEIKNKLFAQLEEVCSETCALATNTSSLSVSSLAAVLKRPENFVGLHFFNPAHLMKLVEIIRAPRTGKELIDASVAYIKSLGKAPVIAKDVPGFIVNRVARNYYNESLRIVTEGVAGIEQVDRIMKSAGFKMGPFELMDLIGNDVNVEVTKSVYEQYFHEPRFTPSTMQQQYVNAGLYGKKTGRGYYDYSEKKDKQ